MGGGLALGRGKVDQKDADDGCEGEADIVLLRIVVPIGGEEVAMSSTSPPTRLHMPKVFSVDNEAMPAAISRAP